MNAKSLLIVWLGVFSLIACRTYSAQNQSYPVVCRLNGSQGIGKIQPDIKFIDPKVGETPDISLDAAKKFQRAKKIYESIDSIVRSYPNYSAAEQHFTSEQIEILRHEQEYSEEDHLYVGAFGCSWYCGGGPDSIFSSSALKSSHDFGYTAGNAHDFSLRTAWVEGATGYGIGESITYRFSKQSPPVTAVEIYNGYMKSEKAWQDNSRVKQLKLYVNSKPYAMLNLLDIKSKQIFTIAKAPGLQGESDDLYLKFEIVEVYKGNKYDDVAISEIEFDGTGVHCFAKGTMIAAPNGEKAIEQLKVGDKVLSLNTVTNKIEEAAVLEVAAQKHHNLYELDFEFIKLVATDDHPFYFGGKLYSIVENNKYGLRTNLLTVGQPVNFLSNGQIGIATLKCIKRLDICEETFTITKLDKNGVFFANTICVTSE
ncbi:MAG: Hint domain-containing protein [Prevotellaceae bacterium]|jgi:hypothetical protein|nr:Hint domain-containing protein [Prevotellaceae bacterium]